MAKPSSWLMITLTFLLTPVAWSAPNDATTFDDALGRAELLLEEGRYEEAETAARNALELAERRFDKAQAYNRLGMALFARGDVGPAKLEAAADAFRQTLELVESPNVHYSLGLVLVTLGRNTEGTVHLETFLEEVPTGPAAEIARGLIDRPAPTPTPAPARTRTRTGHDFEIVTLDGEHLSSIDLRGKVLVLDFWGTWCKACEPGIPHLRGLQRRTAKHPLVVLGIANDHDEDLVRGYLAKHRMDWPQYLDADRRIVRDVFNVTRYPTYIVVDHEGEIVYRRSGWSDTIGMELNRKVSKALKTAKKAAAR